MGGQQVGGARQYIPVKLFAANVMPIIFAQALMFVSPLPWHAAEVKKQRRVLA